MRVLAHRPDRFHRHARARPSCASGATRVTELDSLRPDVHRGPLPQIDGLVRADVRNASALEAILPGKAVAVHLAAKVGLGVDVSGSARLRRFERSTAPQCSWRRNGPRRCRADGDPGQLDGGLRRGVRGVLCRTTGWWSPGPRVWKPSSAAGSVSNRRARSVDETLAPAPGRRGCRRSIRATPTRPARWRRSICRAAVGPRGRRLCGRSVALPQRLRTRAADATPPTPGWPLSSCRPCAGVRHHAVYEDGGQRRDFVHVRRHRRRDRG